MDCEVIVSWIQTVSVKNCGSLVFVPKARDVLAAAVSQSPFMGKRVALLKELTVVLKPSVYKHFAAMRRSPSATQLISRIRKPFRPSARTHNQSEFLGNN